MYCVELQAEVLIDYLFQNEHVCLDMVYNLEGLQLGFLFCAKAVSPSSAFSPDCNASPKRSIVSCVARSTLPCSRLSFNAARVTIAASGEIAAISFANFNASSTTVSCDGDMRLMIFSSFAR